MLKRIIKTVTVAVTIACLVVCIFPIQAFAVDPVSFSALAGALDAYGMAYGIGTVVDVSSSSGVDTSFSGLWDEFSQYQSNNGSNYDYSQFVVDFNENRSIDAFSHSSGKFAAWHIDAESAEIFDQFWNWLLTGPAEMVRVDNEYFQFSSSAIGDDAVPILVYGYGDFSSQPIPGVASSSDYGTLYNSASFLLGSSSTVDLKCYSYSGNTDVVYVFALSSGFVACSPTANQYFGSVGKYVNSNNYVGNNNRIWLQTTTLDSTTGLYYNYLGVNSSSYTVYVPEYSSYQSGLLAVASWLQMPVYSRSISIKSIDDTGVSFLPNPYSQDYVPVPLDLVTSVPWDESYPDSDDDNGIPVPYPPSSIPNVVDDIIGSMVDDTYELVEEDEEPTPPPQEVLLPFIPVNIPSFNFNFSGIWHYVREWVSSLGAWFVTLFSIWSILPYAMVVPVYATAVVVIVLGVYKRFFM